MKNNIDIARLNHDFDEFLHELQYDLLDFKKNLIREYQQDQQEPGESPVKIGTRVIQLIEECMEEKQYWIIGEAFNKGVELLRPLQKYNNSFHDHSYSFWNIIEDSMVKDLEDLAEEEYQQLL